MGAMGYGYGSECHLLRWMGRHRTVFDVAIRAVLGKGGGSPLWIDFDSSKAWADSELKGLQFLEDDQKLQVAWKKWWPQGSGIHNWDAVAWWGTPSSKELVLIEAKAHLGEIQSKCTADRDNCQRRFLA